MTKDELNELVDLVLADCDIDNWPRVRLLVLKAADEIRNPSEDEFVWPAPLTLPPIPCTVSARIERPRLVIELEEN